MDCFFDENERKYYITPESAEKAIEEVKARKIRFNQEQAGFPKASEPFRKLPKDPEKESDQAQKDQIKEFEHKILDLKITNRGKDYFIDQLKKERETLIQGRIDDSRLIGALKTELRQLEAPKENQVKDGEVADITDVEDIGIPTEGQESETEDSKKPPETRGRTKDSWEF